MEFVTIGRGVHSGYRLPLSCTDEDSYLESLPDCSGWSIVVIEKGSGILSFEGVDTPLTAPVILCINETEYPSLIAPSGITMKSVHFDPLVVNSKFNFHNVRSQESEFSNTEEQDLYLLFPFVTRNAKYPFIIPTDAASARHLAQTFTEISDVLEKQKGYNWPCRSRSLLLEALVLISRVADQAGSLTVEENTGIPDIVNEIIIYLHTNYPDKITLNDLSREFHVNRTTLNAQFYQYTNLSVIDYLIKYRVQLAATLLRDTLLPISEIMERVGFHNTTHFWRMFKKHTSVSPSGYRKQYCWL
ncbi:AraC family transcriptional regulator [Gorillibacterium timonense]|uniref:AraC family transcriptional regulator n=1 Tax=Gorillibacterium timonense TaxID=1689269 RepID=UPI000A591775|nr:AraC family transcriptional regulator [Gorillibacterium timonense]